MVPLSLCDGCSRQLAISCGLRCATNFCETGCSRHVVLSCAAVQPPLTRSAAVPPIHSRPEIVKPLQSDNTDDLERNVAQIVGWVRGMMAAVQ